MTTSDGIAVVSILVTILIAIIDRLVGRSKSRRSKVILPSGYVSIVLWAISAVSLVELLSSIHTAMSGVSKGSIVLNVLIALVSAAVFVGSLLIRWR